MRLGPPRQLAPGHALRGQRGRFRGAYNLSLFTVLLIVAQHCTSPNTDPTRADADLATWDQPLEYSTLHLTIESCSFDGTLANGTETDHRAIYVPAGDNYVYVTSNDFFDYAGLVVATIEARACGLSDNYSISLVNGTHATFSHNLVEDAPCAAAELVGFDSIAFSSNEFRGCGCHPPVGSAPAAPQYYYCAFVSVCNATPGFLTINGNSVIGNPIDDCVLGESRGHLDYNATLVLAWQSGLPAAYEIEYLPLSTKITSVSSNRATSDLCIGIRFVNVETWTCSTPDPPKWLRPYWFNGGNAGHSNRAFGQVFDLYWGPTSQDASVAIDPDALVGPPLYPVLSRCYWCNDGCTTSAIAPFVITLGILMAVLLLLCVLGYFLCGACCFCCPCAQAPQGMGFNSYLGIMLPEDEHQWFAAAEETRQLEPVMQDSPLDQQLQAREQAVRQRRALGNYPATSGFSSQDSGAMST